KANGVVFAIITRKKIHSQTEFRWSISIFLVCAAWWRNKMTTHNDQYVLITGATSGIGLELAKVFAEHGFGLIIVARNEITLAPAAKQLSKFYDVPVHYIVADLYSQSEAMKIPDEVSKLGLTVDILVNN